MFKLRNSVLFILLAVAFIPRMIARAENQAHEIGDVEEEGVRSEDLWEIQDEPNFGLKDWSYYNYSSNRLDALHSVVNWGGKFYDPLSFKGGKNDTYAIAFHLSTEVAVSAAQSRNGTLFDVAIVQGNEEYKKMMAQIQQDLKGNRSIYYTEIDWNPGWSWNDFIGVPTYKAYFLRLYNYLKYGPPPRFTPDPTPVFASILRSLQLATEEALGTTLNFREYQYDKGIHISSPWEFNETFIIALKSAMNSLAPGERAEFLGPYPSPWVEWNDHSNDDFNYGGENGTQLAQEQARKGAEMVEMDTGQRYGDFVCGTWYLEEEERIANEMQANGTWVEPLYKSKVQVPWECKNWDECWRAWPWLWNYGH